MKLYRYERWCNNEDLLNMDGSSNVSVRLSEYNVIRETQQFYVFRKSMHVKESRTSKDGLRRFAYPTKEEALCNFIARTRRSIGLSKYNIRYSELALEASEEIKKGAV